MRKSLKIQITILMLAFFALGVYFIPNQMEKKEASCAVKIKADSTLFTQKALEEFEKNKNLKASKVANLVLEELNGLEENNSKKAKPFTFEKDAKGQISVEFDDSLQMITLTNYDKNGKLSLRTVIKPPSYVVYSAKDN